MSAWGVPVGVRLVGCDEKFGLGFGGNWKAWEGSEQGVMSLCKMRKGRERQGERQREKENQEQTQIEAEKERHGQRTKSGKTDTVRKRDTKG